MPASRTLSCWNLSEPPAVRRVAAVHVEAQLGAVEDAGEVVPAIRREHEALRRRHVHPVPGGPASRADDVTEADVAQLPRLYSAASLCMFTGRADDAVGFATTATRPRPGPRSSAS